MARARSRETLGVGLLTAVALALRLLVTRSIWIDEAISIRQARLPFGELLENLRTFDVHPPLHHIVLWVSTRWIGDSEFAVRLPSMLVGTALVPLMYLAGARLWDRRTGAVAAVLITFAPLAVWYSQEARMYSLFLGLATLALLAQAIVLRQSRRRAWTTYTAATVGLLWTQYFGILPVAVQQIAFAVDVTRRRRRGEHVGHILRAWALSSLTIVLAVLPLAGLFTQQFAEVGGGGGGVPSQAGLTSVGAEDAPDIYALLANVIWAVWGYHSDATMAQIVALWPLGILAVILLLGRGRSPQGILLTGLAAVPMMLLFAAGSYRRNLFELRYFIGIVPMLLLLTSRAIASWLSTRAGVVLATAAVVVTLGVGLVDQQLNGTNPRLYDFRGAFALVEANAAPGDLVVYEPEYMADVFRYYSPQLRAQPLAQGPETRGADRVFLVGSFLDIPVVAGRVGGALARLEEERRLVERLEVPNVTIWVFE